MPEHEFHLEITKDSVFVRLKVPGHTRFKALIFFAACTILGLFALLFIPGKQGNASMWHDLMTSPAGSAGFLIPLVLSVGFLLLMISVPRRYVMLAYPSDETLRSDRSTLTISRVRWLDIQNVHRKTRSFPLADVHNIQFQAIARLKSGSVYGFLFVAGGKAWRVLPGLSPRDAEKVLAALKTLGTDVSDDSVLR